MKMSTGTEARCPITGKTGVCPGSSSATSGTEVSTLTPSEQQTTLWKSLLQHNGGLCSVSAQAQQAKQKPAILTPSASSSFHCPELVGSTESFSLSSVSEECPSPFDDDDGSLSSVSETETSSRARLKKNKATNSASVSTSERQWPSYDQLSAFILTSDYHETLISPSDQHVTPTKKMLMPHGVVCQAKCEFFDIPPGMEAYTGLLTPGTTADHCLIRLSSALRPVDYGISNSFAKAALRRTFGPKLSAGKILPAAAIKLFRQDQPSGNILLLGSKVGQTDTNFFRHALCTAVTEKIPSMGIPFLRRFSRYSQYPLSLGLSDVCRYDTRGQKTQEPNFPFCLCLQPVFDGIPSQDGDVPFDTFIEDCQRHVPAGTHLYDIYAAPTPTSVAHSHELQRIGRVVTTSNFLYSSPTDGLTFRHQVKEDDLHLRPDWEQQMHANALTMQDGTKGTIAKFTGWQIFEEHILGRGDYLDYEQHQHLQQQQDGSKRKKRGVAFDKRQNEPPTNVRVPGWTFCGFQKAQVQV